MWKLKGTWLKLWTNCFLAKQAQGRLCYDDGFAESSFQARRHRRSISATEWDGGTLRSSLILRRSMRRSENTGVHRFKSQSSWNGVTQELLDSGVMDKKAETLSGSSRAEAGFQASASQVITLTVGRRHNWESEWAGGAGRKHRQMGDHRLWRHTPFPSVSGSQSTVTCQKTPQKGEGTNWGRLGKPSPDRARPKWDRRAQR